MPCWRVLMQKSALSLAWESRRWWMPLPARSGQSGMIMMVVVDGLFIIMLILCSRWARAGSQGAFLGGMIAYALDGVLLLLFSMWLEAAVHAYALWRIWEGYSASRELAQMQLTAQPGLSQPRLP